MSTNSKLSPEYQESELTELIIDDTPYSTYLSPKFKQRQVYQPEVPGRVSAEIPGLIKNIRVKLHDRVKAGELLLFLEAMKMENWVVAPITGKVTAIHVQEQELVARGALLLDIEPDVA